MIAIILATHNGAPFIARQIDSVLSQSMQDFVLYIQDDCSADGTWEIVQEYAARFPSKIIASQNAVPSGGAGENFFSLMLRHRDDDYIMLCDQDDVWLPDKIETTLGQLRNMEMVWGRNTPLLAHTDCMVADEALNITAPSYRRYAKVDPTRSALKDIVIQNMLTGCTAMYNRALAKMIKGNPAHMVMHDWWLLLVASAFGHIAYMDAPSLLYRQHKGNTLGARNMQSAAFLMRFALRGEAIRAAIHATYPQIEDFLAIYRSQLSAEQIELLTDYLSIPTRTKPGRWRTIIRLGCYKTGILRNLGYFRYV